jgi:hypothetical protein
VARSARAPSSRRGLATAVVALRLQQTIGNAATTAALAPLVARTVPVQRQLKVTGAPADLAATLRLLSTASGLTLKHDPKTGLVTINGAPGKATSPELQSRLQAIIADATRTAQVEVGAPKSDADWFGTFPTDDKNLTQRVYIEQLLALEKAVPGDGVAKLAHEITENFEGQRLIPTHGISASFGASHDVGIAVENKVLDELQGAQGGTRSGSRLSNYSVGVAPPKSGRGRNGDARIFHVEVHQHEFVVIEQVAGRGGAKKMNIKRDAGTGLGTWHLSGFGPSATLPKGSDATLQQIADILSNDPTAAVVLQATADPKSASFAPKWLTAVTDAVVNRTKDDPELRSWGRYGNDTTVSGSTNEVLITVRRPTSIP